MKSDKIFWLGVAVTIVGVVLMSLPARKCEDCEDEISEPMSEILTDAISKVMDLNASDAESPSDG